MAISTQIQNLNLIPGKSAPVVVHLSQGNVGNTVQFYLYDGDDPYYPTNVSIAVHGVRADNTVFGPYAVSVTSVSNLVSFDIVSAMTSVTGAAIGELVISDSNQNQVGSANFGILVEATPYSSSVTYEDDLSIYQRILAYVQSIPAELSGQITAETKIRTEMDANIQSALNTEISERKSADSSEASTRATADANLQSQINQIVAPSGEAPSAAEVQNARIGVDNVTYPTLGEAIRGQVNDLKSDLDDSFAGVKDAIGFDDAIMTETSNFISGARNATGYITHTSRCTTKYVYHVKPGHMISVNGVTNNIKYAMAGVNNGSYVLDSGWQTANAERFISLEGDYFVNVTTANGSGTLSPSDFNLTVKIVPVFSNLLQMRDDIAISTGNKVYSLYDFRFCGYDASGDEVGYGTATWERCTAICKFDKPLYIAINHPDYTLALFWKENGVLHQKTNSPTWEIPANVTVAVVIRRSEVSANPQSMMGETPWKYLFTRSLEDRPRSFYDAEIQDTLIKIAAANTEPSLCFTLSTDHHYMTVMNWLTNYDSISDMSANMKAVGESVKFDFNVSLGDVADFKTPYSEEVANRFGIKDTTPANLDTVFDHWRKYAMYRLKNVNPNFIYVHGNHDDNRYLRVDGGTSGYDYTPGEMYSYYYSNAFKTLEGTNPDNPLEYYFDIDTLGIRVIIIDSNYYTEETGWDYGFSDSTASWLGGVLASSSGKQVLILSHMSPVASHNGDNYAYHNFDAVANVIQTWKENGGDLIALLYGHSHCDWSATSPWLDITFCCQKIHQLPELFENMPGAIAPARSFGTATEDCWNVVIIKPKSRKINIIRFGAGSDREFSY